MVAPFLHPRPAVGTPISLPEISAFSEGPLVLRATGVGTAPPPGATLADGGRRWGMSAPAMPLGTGDEGRV